ncbi:methyltransferase family protein [Arthrobacter pigmenti]
MTASDLLRNLPLPPGQIAGLLAGLVLRRLRPVPLPGPAVTGRAVGAVLLAAGVAINCWAVVERRRREPAVLDLEQPTVLVTTGPYAITRHPMYVGWWLIHLGAGALTRSAWTLITLPLAAITEHPAVLAEERKLAGQFAAQFETYCGRVPRYLLL